VTWIFTPIIHMGKSRTQAATRPTTTGRFLQGEESKIFGAASQVPTNKQIIGDEYECTIGDVDKLERRRRESRDTGDKTDDTECSGVGGRGIGGVLLESP
jgi:hypothetical protein